MKRTHIRMALAVLATCAAASTLLAQVPVPLTPAPTTPPQAPAPTPPPQAMAPMTPPPRPVSFQITGAVTIPVFSYADFLTDFGWMAGGALVVRRGAFNAIRLDGEYNSTGYEASNLSGGAEVYGGGIGGGRVVMKGNVQSEGYIILGLYNHSVCVGTNCTPTSELQFGTKFGTNIVVGRGRVRPVIDIHWLTTWSQPYANLIALGAGLRF